MATAYHIPDTPGKHHTAEAAAGTLKTVHRPVRMPVRSFIVVPTEQ